MSHPHIIWTMRRTGGTSLATLLQRYSPYPVVDHEPFNAGRAWHPIVEKFKTDAREAEKMLREALRKRPVIKNCYDMYPAKLHGLLMQLTTEAGYRHIVLDRRNEADRLLSLALAAQTGSWGRKTARAVYAEILDGTRKLEAISEAYLLKQMRQAAQCRKWLAGTMAAAGLTPHVVFFEEMYGSDADGETRVREVFRFLEIPMEPADRFAADLHETLHKKSQGTGDIVPMVPNISKLKTLLALKLENAEPAFAKK